MKTIKVLFIEETQTYLVRSEYSQGYYSYLTDPDPLKAKDFNTSESLDDFDLDDFDLRAMTNRGKTVRYRFFHVTVEEVV